MKIDIINLDKLLQPLLCYVKSLHIPSMFEIAQPFHKFIWWKMEKWEDRACLDREFEQQMYLNTEICGPKKKTMHLVNLFFTRVFEFCCSF